MLVVCRGGQRGFPSHLPALSPFFCAWCVTSVTRATMFECKVASAMKMNLLNVHIFDLTGQNRQGVTWAPLRYFPTHALFCCRRRHHNGFSASQLSAILISGRTGFQKVASHPMRRHFSVVPFDSLPGAADEDVRRLLRNRGSFYLFIFHCAGQISANVRQTWLATLVNKTNWNGCVGRGNLEETERMVDSTAVLTPFIKYAKQENCMFRTAEGKLWSNFLKQLVSKTIIL